jgi:hypothetical protein
MIHWLDTQDEFRTFAAANERIRKVAEEWLSTKESVDGYCSCCDRITTFQIHSGAMLGSLPSLREGLLCSGCGMSNRSRLIYKVVCEEIRNGNYQGNEVLLLERLSPLYTCLAKEFPGLIGSEFLGMEHQPGREYFYNSEISIRHESLVELSFADASLKMLIHNDILEHIPHYRQAIAEAKRVLCAGGVMVFTCPFFAERQESLVRSIIHEDGSLQHLEPPEFHGDPLNPGQGILAYYHHGWSLIDDIRDAGFKKVQVGVDYDVFSGFVSNNFPGGGYGLMLPIVIRARK